MSRLAETAVVYSIIADSSGGMKVNVVSAVKRQPVPDFDKVSMRSFQSASTGTVKAGQRRRLPSTSSVSSFATVNTFSFLEDTEDQPMPRTSSPVPIASISNASYATITSEKLKGTSTSSPTDDSDCSFTSCVSELSIETSSSQETIVNERVFEPIERPVTPRSYERVNKERYGYDAGDLGDWRTVGPKKKSYQTPGNQQRASQIPRFSSRPTPPSQNRVMSVAPTPRSPAPGSNALAPTPVQLTLQVKVLTGCDGKMRLQFSNSKVSDSFCIDGIFQNSEGIDVRRVADTNNN